MPLEDGAAGCKMRRGNVPEQEYDMKKHRVIAALAACLLAQAASAEVVLYSYKGDIRRCEIPVSVIHHHLEEQPYYEIQRGTCPYIRIVDDEARGQNPPPAELRTESAPEDVPISNR